MGRARGRAPRGQGRADRQPTGSKGLFLSPGASEDFCAGDPTKRAWGCGLGLGSSPWSGSGRHLWCQSASSHTRWPVG